MNIPINTTDECAFTLRAAGYDKHCYLNALNGGGAFPGDGGAGGICHTLTSHYHKEAWSNFLPDTKSLIKATGIIEIFDYDGDNKLEQG